MNKVVDGYVFAGLADGDPHSRPLLLAFALVLVHVLLGLDPIFDLCDEGLERDVIELEINCVVITKEFGDERHRSLQVPKVYVQISC